MGSPYTGCEYHSIWLPTFHSNMVSVLRRTSNIYKVAIAFSPFLLSIPVSGLSLESWSLLGYSSNWDWPKLKISESSRKTSRDIWPDDFAKRPAEKHKGTESPKMF